MCNWYVKWWALPAFTDRGRAVNRWSFASLNDAHRPTENAAFERMYKQAEEAKRVRRQTKPMGQATQRNR